MLEDVGFIEDLPTLLVIDFLLSTGIVAGPKLLVCLIFFKLSKRLIFGTDCS
jgi:hypothetical protein